MSYLIYFAFIMLIPLFAQFKVKSAYNKYLKVPSSTGMTGAQAARRILDANNLMNVTVEETKGFLSDHYDPRSKTVRLSTNNYHGTSIAGVTIAAHEVGHAIQDATDYSFLRFRHSMVPVVNLTSNFSWIFIMIGIFAQMSGMLLIGIIVIAIGVLFQLVTLPVEFDASSRAVVQMKQLGIIGHGEDKGAKSVLNAAALTYVAAAAVGVMELLRLVTIYTGMQRDE